MAEKPMFFFTGVYDDLAGAEADYATVKALHDADDMGSYDAAIVTKHADGRVRVTKTEKPAHHGAYERLERMTGAKRHTMKPVDGDFEEAEHEALVAMEQATS
jgi:hypothetical protein